MGSNNGQKGYIEEDQIYLNEGNTVSFGQDTATMFYQDKPYFTGDKIKILEPRDRSFNKSNAQFFITAMMKSFSSFSWGSSSFNVDIIKNQKIKLPISKNDRINFKLIEEIIVDIEKLHIAEIESNHKSELKAYLSVAKIENYELTQVENKVLKDFENQAIEFSEFTYKNIFNKIKQGRRLKKDDQLPGDIPFIMAGVTNTGVTNYVSNPVASFPLNSITIDIFGNTFYRDFSFGAGDDTGVYWNDEVDYSPKTMIFFAAAMKRSILGKFTFGKKLRSSQSLDFKMKLPSIGNDVDVNTITTLISAVRKLIIMDIINKTNETINATKSVCANEN